MTVIAPIRQVATKIIVVGQSQSMQNQCFGIAPANKGSFKMNDMKIGAAARRVEDQRLLLGRGRYLDDVNELNQAWAYVLRSPHAHADIRSIDTAEALKAHGVLAILTAEDVAARGLGRLRPTAPRKRSDGSDGFVTPRPLLAEKRVRFAGEAVAFVVAETKNAARDAAERIIVDYKTLPVVASVDDALKSEAPILWEDAKNNEAYQFQTGNKEQTDKAFKDAAHVIRHRVCVSRVIGSPMENRGCIASYDSYEDLYTLRATIQAAHGTRATIANQIMQIPQTKLRVICDNMGGGFGTRGGCEPEYSLCLWASEIVDRPVKWIAERSESFLTDEQGRGGLADAELALDSDFNFLGIRTHTKVPIGAYYTSDRNFGSATGAFSGMTGPYRMPALHATVTGAFTNMIGNAQYRGGAKPEPVHILEVMVDHAARELNIDPAELRRRNMIRVNELPYKNCMGDTYDCGEFIENMDTCLEAGDYSGFDKRNADAAKEGKIRGIGLANSICGVATVNYEHAEVRFNNGGDVTLLCGAMDHGQGHQTVFRQILADKLGMDASRIQYRFGDTEKVTMGVGTFNARCATLAGSAVSIAADKVIEKGKRIAAHMLEAKVEDIQFSDGQFNLKGSNRFVDLDDVVKTAFVRPKLPADIEPGLYERGDFGSTTGAVYPNGCHLAEVEIDLETGQLELVRYTCVDDAGTILNPLLFDGQIHGGIVQGVGQILMESAEYDRESGQLVSGSFMDYAMPKAGDFCHFDLLANEVPTARNPLGVKGVGEAGTVGAMPAVMNAVSDALHRVGIEPIEMPVTANKIWQALNTQKKTAA